MVRYDFMAKEDKNYRYLHSTTNQYRRVNTVVLLVETISHASSLTYLTLDEHKA